MDKLRKLIKWTAVALAAVAIVEQLGRPADERTWEGTVAGFVPYDFRPPTVERARSRWWRPRRAQALRPAGLRRRLDGQRRAIGAPRPRPGRRRGGVERPRAPYMFAISSISFALSSVTITTREFVAR